MAHRFDRHEDIGVALRRLVLDDLATARADLRVGGSREVRVHGIRKRLKRVRSLLKVLRPVAPAEAEALRRHLSITARLLARARDADVAAATARGLAENVAAAEEAGLARVADDLGRQAEAAHGRETPVAGIARRLAAAEAAFADLPAAEDGARLYDAAIRRAYKRGRRALTKAQSSLATPDLHEWRKGAKDLWHLLDLGRKRLPKAARRLAGRLEALGEILGEDHDHAMLAERLALSPTADPGLMRQLSIIAGERRRLEKEGFARGAALYKRKPKRFARRIRLA